MKSSTVSALSLLGVSFLAMMTGCELIARVDRTLISGTGGASPITTTGTGTTTSSTGTGGAGTGGMTATSSSTGGTGGAGTGGMGTGGMGGKGGMTATSTGTGGAGTGGMTATGTGGMGTGGMGGCVMGTDCPGADDDCQQRTCTAGVCGKAFTADGTATTAQSSGDCSKNVCDGAGNVKLVPDGADPLVDGNPCTDDLCTPGPTNPPSAVGTACSVGKGKVCDGAGKCVECLMGTDCASGICTGGACVPASCSDTTLNGTETDVDCGGGACPTCVDGKLCAVAGDCADGVCSGNPATCQVPVCTDHVANGVETDVDCGGGVCPTCATGQGCKVGADCIGGSCSGTTCLPTCTDKLKNGGETDVDCGGPTCGKCANGRTCGGNGDCTSGACAGGVCVECNAATQCPGSDTECHVRTCNANACGVSNTAAGTPTVAQTPGDCMRSQCDGAGNIAVVVDNSDVPADDGNACTSEVCTAGVPSHPAKPADTACNQGGGSVCNGAGLCVQCNAAAQCPGSDTECHTRTCNAHACGVNNTAAGTVTAAQTPGDCQKNQCDGAGNIVPVADNSDVPADDGNQCTFDVCLAGVPSHPAKPANNPCNQGGGSFCNAGGVCVQCNAATECPGSDTECHTRTCAAGTCGVNNTASGTATSAQTAGDCQKNQCDGAGNIVPVADNSDAPADDGNQCTSDVCVAGAPSHPSKPAGTVCNQGGGTLCNATGSCVAASCNDSTKNGTETGVDCGGGACPACPVGQGCSGNADCQSNACVGGLCVQCVAASQCPGSDTECHVRTCNANTCGGNNTAAGTPTSAQTPGDCHTNQCDGAGNIAAVVDNSDVPADDGNQCTGEVCTAGAPSHPAKPVDTACSQGGGSFCNGAGSCVQCNAVAECPGSDTECHVRTCAGNTCGANNTAAGTPTSAQTPGDCMQNQCDGAGNVVPVIDNSDVPADDGSQCTGEVCTAGVPSHPAVPVDTACNQGGGSVCNGAGSCVQCNTATECPGSDTDCQVRTCVAGACGTNDTPAGTPTSAQAPGDCMQNQCDGLGGSVAVIDNTDLPADDGNQCTGEVCTAGVPSHPDQPLGTACSQSSGTLCDGAGNCVAAPQVASTTPSDATTPVAAPAVSVTFTVAMSPATLTGQTAAGACSGSVQVSLDGFASCVAFSSAAAVMSGGNTTASFTAAPGLLVNRVYQIRVTTAAQSAVGIALGSQFTQPTGFTTKSPNLCDGSLVISQVYAGGGNASAQFNHDFVELHNRGTTTVNLAGMSLQYTSTAGTVWNAGGTGIALLSGSIPAGGYFLVQLGTNNTAIGAALTQDLTPAAAINMAASNGKVALINSAVQIADGACPPAATTIDFVGYGTASCKEGAAAAPTLSNTTADFRAQSGCADVNNNGAEFTNAVPVPRNSATAPAQCACLVENESNDPLGNPLHNEADYCDTQFPLSLTVANGSAQTVFGRIFESGVTGMGSANASVRAQLGYGPASANPEYEAGWTWTNATYNAACGGCGSNDEYQATFTTPAVGTYRYVYRFSLDQGVSWTYADNDQGDFGAGSNANLTFDFANEAVLTSQ